MIHHDTENNCFRTEEGAVLEYTLQDGHYLFDRTEVPPACRGKGVAGQLTRFALEHARKEGWQIVPACSYIEVYLKRHPEYRDLLAARED